MKTRDKILLSSLELFNDKGERNITTNHTTIKKCQSAQLYTSYFWLDSYYCDLDRHLRVAFFYFE